MGNVGGRKSAGGNSAISKQGENQTQGQGVGEGNVASVHGCCQKA